MKKENNKIKFDFSNKESQKLFEELTVILAEMTKYIENLDKQLILKNLEIIELGDKQNELLVKLKLFGSGRYIIKVLFNKLINRVFAIVKYIPKKIINKIKDILK